MLKGIDPLLVPELLDALARMGHGDLIAVVDRNFPAHTRAQRTVELPNASASQVLEAVLSVLPLDSHDEPAVIHMLTDDGEESPATPALRELWSRAEGREVGETGIKRHDGFYELAAGAYVTVRTAETLPYACYLLKKGTL